MKFREQRIGQDIKKNFLREALIKIGSGEDELYEFEKINDSDGRVDDEE